jgi:hypothetical protein
MRVNDAPATIIDYFRPDEPFLDILGNILFSKFLKISLS